ncbi:uncharacterized protein [Dermacentor andersoni]|uniref:uncharacterized protein isoform X1 n=2 Tax=Dermacentor andersoni TaxID=34620 RepID=UPI00215536AC|nr:uncharacterized protein LOC126533878 isoform X1 [Dermacentor andersoni]
MPAISSVRRRTGSIQSCQPIESRLSQTDSAGEHDQRQETMRELSNTEQGGGLSKLDRLKAVLEESRRKKAASPQDVPPPLMPAALQGASCKEALPNCAVPVASNNCSEKDAVHNIPVRTTSPEQTSEKAKRLKELLERQARKKATMHLLSSPTPPVLDQVSEHGEKMHGEFSKGGENSSVALPSSALPSKKDSECSIGQFPCSRLPLGTRVPVVFLRLGEGKKVIYLQEMSALRDLVKMVKCLNAVASKESQHIEEPVPGALVAVLHEKDSTWYRGQIDPVQCDKKDPASGDGSIKKVRVWFIDYGRWDDVPLDCLRPMPNTFERLPGFAIPTTLHGLRKVRLPKDIAFEGSFFDAEVVTDGDQQSVRLYIRNDDLCLNDTLAVYAESASGPSAA